MTNAKDGAWWCGWFYQGAAVYAGAIGQVPAAALFGGISLFFQGASQGIGHRLEQASNNRC